MIFLSKVVKYCTRRDELCMNIENLSKSEVTVLIKSLKNCEKEIPGEMPLIGRIKDDTPVIDFKYHVKYILHRYRNPIDASRFSMHIRFTDIDSMLIRIDINNGSHKNPDGTKVPQNHMHIYNAEGGTRRDSVAVPLPDDIKDVSSLFTVLEEFLEYTNTATFKE